ncbi:MAG TPA: hypothetical protein VE442_11535 [Jatrophihabitans sp.]|jgi:hypothetical protein|nr:hypothetical protein [Jatrophihabitans sp.]
MRTYVVRVQDSRASDQPTELRGVADEVATGERSTFTSGAELLRLLASRVGSADNRPSGDAQ